MGLDQGIETVWDRLGREPENIVVNGDGTVLPHDVLRHALSVQSRRWPETKVGLGELEPGWITADGFFSSEAAVENYLTYKGSLRNGGDRKTCAASMMLDYGNIFSIATVPMFVGFGIVPELDPRHFAVRFRTDVCDDSEMEHGIRQADVRFLSSGFWTENAQDAEHPDARDLLDHEGLCARYRCSVENHFAPLVEVLFRQTGLSRSALWRLVGDSIAGHFLEAGRRCGRLEAGKAAGMTIFKQPGSPLNNRQLHYFDLTLRDAQGRELISWTFRRRGGCCRFYLVADGALCETCVLKKPEERDAELLEHMRRRFAEITGMTV